jgi:peptidoglycan/LPS O-acetylase OafA/YrhL
MFGGLRFFLALLVLFSHLNLPSPLGLNLGVIAVVIFYLLAGYVVQHLLSQVFIGEGAIRAFYHDRALRIFPQYLFAMLVATFIWAFLSPQTSFLAHSPTLWDWLANLLIVPLNFYMFTGQDAFTLIPPAWSLGAELQFYLLAPWLLLLVWFRRFLIIIVIFVFFAAQMSWLDSDVYGYRLLVGVLFIFYLGAVLHQGYVKLILAVGMVFAFYALWLLMHMPQPYFLREVALGIVIGIPVLFGLAQLRAAGKVKVIDSVLGKLSYGIFLFHFSVIWLMQFALPEMNGWGQLLLVLGLSLGFAAIGHYVVERYMWERLGRYKRK